MIINCLIIDDDPLASIVIENFLLKTPNINIVGKIDKAIEAFEIINQEQVDLIFLDIQMPDLSGIDFLKILKKRPRVILTTAYKDYAIDGFELEVLDFLLKPITFDRFMKAINRYRLSEKKEPKRVKTILSKTKIQKSSSNAIYIKEAYKTVKVLLNDILYIESFRENVIITTKDKEIKTRQTLSYFEKNLDSSKFIRVHRSFLISLRKIKSFTQHEIEINNKSIPIGRSFKVKIAEILGSLN